ncbi:MAG: hypothetical protein Rhirs2KO_23480 [Rhizobiaceae bacterium]
MVEHFQMRGGGVLHRAQLPRDFAGGQAFSAAAHQQAKHIEPGFLTEGGKRGEGRLFIHISKILDILETNSRARQRGQASAIGSPVLSAAICGFSMFEMASRPAGVSA